MGCGMLESVLGSKTTRRITYLNGYLVEDLPLRASHTPCDRER